MSRLFLAVLGTWVAVSSLTAHNSLWAQQAASAHWVGSWASSQETPETANTLPPEEFRHAVLRQVVHLSIGGERIRVHVSNAFGTQPLHLLAVHVAKPVTAAGAAIDVATDRTVSFSGAADVTIPAGADYVSDAVTFHAAALSDLAITMQFDEPPVGETSHPGSRATSYLAPGSDAAVKDLPEAKHFDHWFDLSGVDVAAGPDAAAVVMLGDSITDGHGTTVNGNDRWPDVLAARAGGFGVLNQGIGGNRLLLDGLGPNALARFDRDVIAQAGVKYVVVLEGVNDLGTATRTQEISQAEHDALVARILGAYMQMIDRAHAKGLRIYGATITPYTGSDYYHPGAMSEGDRQKINAWIRAVGHFDACVDFDKAVADPADGKRLLPGYDSGDHLHPSVKGYKAMGDAVDVGLFQAQR